MGVDRIITAGLTLALGTALACAGPVMASPVAAAEGAAAQVRSTDDTTATVDDTSVPAAPLSSFVGSISTPARGETTVHVNGDLVLTPESCPRSHGKADDRPCPGGLTPALDAGAGRDPGNTPRGLEFAPSLRQVSVRKRSGGCGLRAYESA